MRAVTLLVFASMLLSGIALPGSFPEPAHAAGNPIVVENQLPGTNEWQIPNSSGTAVADDAANQIKGYASAPSVNKGSSISFFVTVNPAQTFTMDIYRLGYYQGRGGRLVQHVNPINGVAQPACPMLDPATHLVSCGWAASYTLTVPTTWTDGVYLVVLTNANQYQNYINFVVRDDARPAALLYQESVNTYQAYNDWGGYSLYSYNSLGKTRAYKVSFDRPYQDDGSGDFFGWEVYFVQWAEQHGYDLTYATDVDAVTNPARLVSVKGVLVVGHSEYWTKEMYDAAEHARDAGVSLGFFGGNDIYWQARYEASASGAANRVLVSYKTSDGPNATDPITASSPTLTTDLWRNALPHRPEQALVGIMFSSQTGNGWNGTVADVITNSGHPIYAGTGFSDGSSIPSIVGYEADRWWQAYPLPSNQSYTLLAHSPYTNTGGASDYANTAIYQALSGAWVFAAGSMGWNYALARNGYVNPGIQQTTANVLNLFVSNVPIAVTATPTATIPPTPTPAPSGYRDAVNADHPISYWRVNESGGTTAADWEQATNGSYVNTPSLAQPGALLGEADGAVGVNGTNQYVSVPLTAALNPSTFSVEVWAKPTGGVGTYRGVMASRFYPKGWVLYAGSNNLWQFWVNSGNGMQTVSGGPVVLNAWTHLVGTFNGTTARLYVNGVLVGIGTVASYQPQTTRALAIGQGEPGSGFWFPGLVDEPAVYGTDLNATQIQTHYQMGSQSLPVTPTSTASPTSTRTATTTNTPTASVTPTATATIAPTDTATNTPTDTATSTPTSSVTSTPTDTATSTQTDTSTATPADTATHTPTNTPTDTSTATPTDTATNTPIDTATNTPTDTATKTATSTPTDTATITPTATPTDTATSTPTETATNMPTSTSTATATYTATSTDTATITATNTPTASPTNTPTDTATSTPTDTATTTPTSTDTPTETATNSPTATDTPIDTATNTPTATETPIDTATNTPTATDTATNSLTNTATSTPTDTVTNTPSDTPTDTATNTPTDTPTAAATTTPTDTATNTPTDIPTLTATNSPTATDTPMDTATASNSPTITSTPTSSATKTATATNTLTTTTTSTPTNTATNAPTLTPTVVASTVYRDAVHANHPISYWRLDESSGTSAVDWEHANNGSYVGSPTLGLPGALAGDADSAVSFNGTTQYVTVPYSAALNPATFSVEAWVKPTGGVGTYRGVMASRSFPNGWVLYAGSNNLWQFWVNNGTGMLSVSGGAVALNAWTHLVGTVSGTAVRLYVNGILVGSGTVTSYQPQTTRPLTIGQGEPGSGFFFQGLIDEPAVYGNALTTTQVQNDYLLGSQGTSATPTPTASLTSTSTATATVTVTRTSTATPSSTPTIAISVYRDAVHANHPISYWRLDESSGTSAVDWEHANNGSYVGNPTLGQPGALAGDPDSAVSFNGTTQYVSVPYAAALNPATFSVEAWAKPTGGAGTYRGVMASRSFPNGWVLYAGSNNLWQFWVNNGTGMLSVSGGAVALNAWTHLVGTVSGTSVRLYVNGVLVGSGTLTSYQPQTGKPLTVGQGEPGSGFFLPGLVDEPAVYTSALTAGQVQNDYLLGTTAPTATPTAGP